MRNSEVRRVQRRMEAEAAEKQKKAERAGAPPVIASVRLN